MDDFVSNSGKELYFLKRFNDLSDINLKIVEQMLNLPAFKKVMDEEKFDVVLTECLTIDVSLGLAAHFNALSIVMSSLEPQPQMNRVLGNPRSLSFIAFGMSTLREPMTFFQRVNNIVFGFIFDLLEGYALYKNDKLYEYELTIFKKNSKLKQANFYLNRKYFPPSRYPPIDDLRKNVSLGLINYHFSQGNPRPMVPAMIEVGGLQIKDPPSLLPKNLQDWLDGAEHGVIYMSMGSNIKSAGLSPKVLSSIINSFAKLKERIIWKFENDSLPGLSKNIMISEWLPQSDLLAHPKLKLFITHGGLGGIIEARHYGIPLVGIPIFGDQMANCRMAQEEGMAEVVHYNDLTEESFTNVIKTVLYNSNYEQKAKLISRTFRDRPEKPMETAIFWVEYVIRHRGAKHMQANSVHLNTFQLLSLDVIGFLFLIGSVIMTITIELFKCLIQRVCINEKYKRINVGAETNKKEI